MPKPSSGKRKRATVIIPLAKNIKQANELAVKYGLATDADFSGLSVKAANEMIQQLNATRNDYPGSVETLRFIGSHQGYNKDRVHPLEMDKTIWAYTVGYPFPALVLNDNYFNSAGYGKALTSIKKNAKHSKFHPEGCNTLKSVIDHEIGHLIDNHYAISYSINKNRKDTLPVALFKKNFSWEIEEGLSRYATTNAAEFIAEAWSEYRNNPKPREIAKAVGRDIIKTIKNKGE